MLRRDFLIAATALMGEAGFAITPPATVVNAWTQAGKTAGESDTIQLVPTPKFINVSNEPVEFVKGVSLAIVLGPGKDEHREKAKLAADFLRRDLQRLDSSVRVEILADSRTVSADHKIYL